jgi:membrane protein
MDISALWRPLERTRDRARARWAVFDHFMCMLEQYGQVNGGGQAGAITYFAFLAFFPIVAIAFFVIGQVANVYPEARDSMTSTLNDILDRIGAKGSIDIKVFQDNANRVGVFGLLGFAYAGLGWMSSMRAALQIMFNKPPKERPNFFLGKARDLMTMGATGVMLLASITISALVSHFSHDILDQVGMSTESFWARFGVWLVGALVALTLTTVLLMALYHLLARPRVAHKALREGALLAAVGFEVLKLLANAIIAKTSHQPAIAVFGFALVLLVLINYFSRAVMYGAAWAVTSKRPPDLYVDEPLGPHWRPAPTESELSDEE